MSEINSNQGKMYNFSKGFTLIEILLVIAIVLVVGFFSAAFTTRLMPAMAVSSASSEFKSVLTKAKAYAISSKEHSSWGVHYAEPYLILFKGESWDNRDEMFDEKTKLDEKIEISGFDLAVFSESSGAPTQTVGQVSISWQGKEVSNVFINSEGVVE